MVNYTSYANRIQLLFVILNKIMAEFQPKPLEKKNPLQRLKIFFQYIVEPELSTTDEYLNDLGLTWGLLRGKKVLDIGAGSADFAASARKRQVDVISLDKYKYSKPSKNQPYVKGNAFNLPFSPETFNTVVARETIKHMVNNREDAEKLLPEINRVLKPEGEFRFDFAFYSGLTNFAGEKQEDTIMDHEARVRAGQNMLKVFRQINPNITVHFVSKDINPDITHIIDNKSFPDPGEVMYFVMKKPR